MSCAAGDSTDLRHRLWRDAQCASGTSRNHANKKAGVGNSPKRVQVPKIRSLFLEVLIMWIRAQGGPFWGPLFSGNPKYGVLGVPIIGIGSALPNHVLSKNDQVHKCLPSTKASAGHRGARSATPSALALGVGRVALISGSRRCERNRHGRYTVCTYMTYIYIEREMHTQTEKHSHIYIYIYIYSFNLFICLFFIYLHTICSIHKLYASMCI